MYFEFFFVLLITASLTFVLMKGLYQFGVHDVPNTRSSHQKVTPRGGGIAFVIVIGCLFYLYDFAWALLALIPIAFISLWDDVFSNASIKVRLAVQLAGSIYGLLWVLEANNELSILTITGLIFFVGITIFAVWLINLVNFMDGIDGIVAIEFISAFIIMALILEFIFLEHEYAKFYILISASLMGFLVLNWSPAKVFMGDVGSVFLGAVLVIVIGLSSLVDILLLYSWLILMGVFIVDATYTLAYRFFSKNNVFEAHRSHGYQIASRHLKSHAKVSILVLGINLVWLGPWAWFTATQTIQPYIAIISAYSLLIFIAYKLKAGSTNQ